MNLSDSTSDSLRDRLLKVKEIIDLSCSRCRRVPSDIRLVAVTKTLPQSIIRKAYALGVRFFGENRVQEIDDKYGDGTLFRECPELGLHMIGHLQTNKVRKAVHIVSAIDSLDSVRVGKMVSNEAQEGNKTIRVLLEVNTSGEPQKNGLMPVDVLTCAEAVLALPALQLAGLMTVGPNVDDPDTIRRSFALLRNTFDMVAQILNPPSWKVLSMGMSGDYPVAIEEGATEIRLGTALFGERRTA